MRFKKRIDYRRFPLTIKWIEMIEEVGRDEKRHNLFFWQRKNCYDKMHRNELVQKKAARKARKNKYKQDKED